jgi:hydrogenase nickel incorporation protein HypB
VDVAIITKIDLAEAVEADIALLTSNIQGVRPGIQIFQASSRSGKGMSDLLQYFISRREPVTAQAG